MVIQASLIILVLYNYAETQGWNKFGIFVTINPLQVKATYYGKLDNHMPLKMVVNIRHD